MNLTRLDYNGYSAVIDQGNPDSIARFFARWRTGSPWYSLNIAMRNRLRRAMGRMIGRRA